MVDNPQCPAGLGLRGQVLRARGDVHKLLQALDALVVVADGLEGARECGLRLALALQVFELLADLIEGGEVRQGLLRVIVAAVHAPEPVRRIPLVADVARAPCGLEALLVLGDAIAVAPLLLERLADLAVDPHERAEGELHLLVLALRVREREGSLVVLLGRGEVPGRAVAVPQAVVRAHFAPRVPRELADLKASLIEVDARLRVIARLVVLRERFVGREHARRAPLAPRLLGCDERVLEEPQVLE
mmetsp:Transcript_6427/g.18137  ORF Transcript_6427/g.18137 Transcript_6427/m.18137 type:complete len:246 (+) Transcript_6427:2662-3399(+)